VDENAANEFLQGSVMGQRLRDSLFLVLLATGPMGAVSLSTLVGCNSPKNDNSVSANASSSTNLLNRGTRIAAQGQLLPADGIVRLVGTPGDRIAEVLAKVGATVQAKDPLIRFGSQQLRELELKVAEQKLFEAESAFAAKLHENSELIAAAEQELILAKSQLESAQAQLELAKSGTKSVDIANQNVERMEKLVKDPATSNTVSRSSVDQQKLQQQQLATQQKEAELAAEHSKKLAEFQVTAAEKKVAALNDSREWINKTSPLGSLKTQLELVRYQFEQTELKAPVAGKILRVDASKGGSIGTLPLIEMANTSKMICQAEISEVDVQRLQVGQKAAMSSPALSQTLQGVVIRIDPIVGTPQYRSPNPLAPVDYRVVQAIIELDAASAPLADDFVQLQVDVAIDVVASTESSSK
jgi:HlyD family secretion protein